MIIYQLHEGVRRGHMSEIGLFKSVEAAKKVAEAKLDTYHEFDGDDDVEKVNFDAQWEMKRETIGHNPPREFGKPKLFLVYGLEYDTAFRITERELLD